ncbi:m7GpppX diphosphatase [Phytophthora nicotianae]|uniref:M7GpppX diphosphatase n=1 Tax=Phytophthora nicotianae TaxID=4792 RepID=A0A0W8CW99_PHYNI|nr:m7GpppX diphosphatase [Phytophthora nicotianae]
MSSTKRALEVDSAHERAKRSRRTRWGHDEDEDKDAANRKTSASPKALSDIVKRLSSVVQEKSTPEELQALAAAASRPLVGAGGQLDAQAARARALAQASLLSLNVPGAKVSPNDLARRLYIGNLYYDLKEEDISNVFAPFGTIRSIDLSLEPGLTVRRASRSKGFCFLEYDDVLAAESAVQVLNGTPLANRAIRHRGYGFMEFVEESCALSAIQHMNGFELAGQPLKVGKASEAAMLINLATSQDKVVRDGSGATADGANGVSEPEKKPFGEDDVEKVRDTTETDEKCCLCLMNLVNRGEVDDELEDEVRGECGKFGIVKKVEIHELADHVRVFVLFDDAAGAAKAKQALHGRFFGGNQVQAQYYPLREWEHKRYTSEFL